MVTKDIFRAIIKEGQELLESVELYERPYTFEDNGRYVLVGIRQAGKSYLLYQPCAAVVARRHRHTQHCAYRL